MISAVVLTKNEEKNIVDCIEGLLFCDEIIIVDDNSMDHTQDLLENYIKNQKIKFFRRGLDNFSNQRNFGIENAANDWIFFIDADERVPASLAEEIKETLVESGDKYQGYKIKRRDFMWGKELKHGETAGISLLRLANKKYGKWEGAVHESWKIKGSIGNLNRAIKHYPHQSISEFLKEINFYTDLRAKELYEKRVKSNFFSIIIYTKGKFFVNYFIKLGILDGTSGIVFALIMAFHSFLVRSKLWLLWQREPR